MHDYHWLNPRTFPQVWGLTMLSDVSNALSFRPEVYGFVLDVTLKYSLCMHVYIEYKQAVYLCVYIYIHCTYV